MCLIAFAWRKHPRYRLVLAANRDEFHSRPTAPAQAWADLPGVHGGRVMAANVEEPAEFAVISTHNHNRLAGHVCRDVLARLSHLIRARRELP